MADIENLYNKYYCFIFKFLFSLSKNESVADELTQEAFFRAYVNIKSLRNDAKASAWLCQIAKNLYFNWYNEQKKLSDLESMPELKDSNDMAEELEIRSLSEEVLHHLSQLEEPYKEVFMLAVMGQVSLKDISLAFGKSESWARVTFYRAKQKIIESMR